MEWETPLWDLAATQILIEEAGGSFRYVNNSDIEGEQHLYSAVFGKPALVKRMLEIIEGAI